MSFNILECLLQSLLYLLKKIRYLHFNGIFCFAASTPKSAQCPALGEFSLQLSQFQYHHNVQMDANMNSFGIGSNAQGLCETNGTLRMGCTSLDFLQLEISSKCHDHNDPEGNLDDKPTSREVTGHSFL